MLTHKEIDYKITQLVYNGGGELVEIIRHGNAGVTTIRTIKLESYSTDLNLALSAAKYIADKNNYTFVLTYLPESSEWKASFGDYRDCSEYSGGNAAYCTCIAVLQFMGKA
jgi:hypothetical protein